MSVREGYKVTELGEMPVEWEVHNVNSICEKIIDYRGRTPEFSNKGIVHLRSNNIKNSKINFDDIKYVTSETYEKYMTRGIPKENDVLFVTEGNIGQTAIVPDNLKFSLAQRIIVFRPQKGFSSGVFLKYKFSSDSFIDKCFEMASGSTIKGISSKNIKSIKFIVPPLPEQQKIAEILSTNDELISKTDEMLEKTKEIKKGLMQELLTRGIGHTDFKDSELGSVPVEWEVLNLKELVLKITDGAHKTPTYTESGIPFLRVTDIQNKNIKWAKVKFISKEEHELLIKRCNPEYGDILYSKNGTIGISKIIDWKNIFSIFVSLCLIKIKKENSKVVNIFLEKFLSSHNCLNQIRLRAKQGTVTNLHLEEIRELKIPVPPLPEQQQIADILTSIDSKIESLTNRKEKLEEIKKGLMQDLLTGRIRVKLD